jgi:hypothetical protein
VVASLYDVTRKYPQYWGGPRSIEECIRRWVLDTKLSLKYKTNPKHHFISYENLVFNPCHELNLLTQFLKIDFCDQMLTNQKQGYEKIRESNAKWTKRAFRSPEKQLKSKFETVFTQKEQSLIKERLENAGLLTLPNF